MSDTAPSAASRPAIADLASITHEGKVLVVGAGFDGVLHYTVRQSGFEDTAVDADSVQAMPGFEQWRAVPLSGSTDDPSVRAEEAAKLVDGSGNPIMRSRYGSDAARSAVARPKLISGLGHLYLFRISVDNTLLMNRFVLDGMTNELVPKLEVRFRRSEQKLVPEGGLSASGKAGHDTLGYRDPDQNLFYEPTQELNFLGTFEADKPWFSVELMPTAEHERYRWNFFVMTGGELRLVSVAASEEGLIEITDQIKTQTDPDMVDQRIIRTIPGIVDRRLELPGRVVACFDTSLYHNQVERKTKAGPQLLKESTRVMLSVPIQQPAFDEPVVAAVSFAVNNLGELAQIDRLANSDEILIGKSKEVLLPLADLEDIKLIADRTPPPMGSINKLSQSAEESVAIHTDVDLDGKLREGQQVKLSGTKSYDGVYVATAIDDGTFEIAAVFDKSKEGSGTGQGHWEVVEDDDSGLVFENMIASYERTASGGLKISCLSHNITEGDEIEIVGSRNHDGVYPITDVGEDNSFELDQVWPTGEVVNLSRRPRRGLSFDGRGDYLKTGPIEFQPHFSNARLERSISAWVNLSEITNEAQTIFATSSRLLHLYVDSNGKATFEVGFSDGYKAKVVDTEPLPTQAWIHLTAMLDYQGETTGDTKLLISRGGGKPTETVVQARKPLNLPLRNLRIRDQALPISTVQYDMNRSDAITIEGWISTRSSGRGVITSWDQNGRFELAVSGSGSDRVAEWVTGTHVMQGTVRLANNQWHHIAGTFDPATGAKSIYVNGELDSTTTAEGAVDAADRAVTESEFADAKTTKNPQPLGFLGAGTIRPEVTAANVTSVNIAGGSLKQAGPRRWFQLDTNGRKVSEQMRETGRAGDVVRLQPEGMEGSHRFELDLARMVVDRIDYNRAIDQKSMTSESDQANDRPGNHTSLGIGFSMPDLGAATLRAMARQKEEEEGREEREAQAREAAAAQARRRESIATSARTFIESAMRFDYDGGYYVKKSAGWQHYDSSGNTIGEPMPETSRDYFAVYAANPTTGDRRVFNRRAKTINGVDGVSTRKAHDITGAVSLSKDPAPNDRFDGYVADVRIWNRVRSKNLIATTRHHQLTGTERNLVAHWPLTETGGRQLSDLTKSMAHIDRSVAGAKVAWFLEPHRAPGERDHYEGRTYDDSLTMAAQLDQSDRNVLRLDGNGGHLKIPTVNDDISAGYTITAWARWDSFQYWTRVFEIGNGVYNGNILLGNAERTNGLALWTCSDEDGSYVTARVDAPGALTAGTWTHVAATVDPVGRATLYVDGKSVANGNVRVPESIPRRINYVGRNSWPDQPFFNGAIRDLQFWGRPLEPDEVKHFMNTDVQGTEDGLLHHWPMRTATIKGKKRVVDQGVGGARHADLVGGAVAEAETLEASPVALTELRGKLSDVQLWTVNRPIETVRRTMHDQLTGNEYGLAGYWRCGGILQDETPGAQTRVTPDFAAEAHDAVVVGDTYLSARDLPRMNSVGKAVKFSNDDLVAVSQRGRYRETFEFRAVRYDGEHLTAEDLEDVDGRGNAIFEFSYWGRKSRTSEERIDFRHDQAYEFTALGDGWFQARCDITIPDGINLIRSFEIDEVSGRWSDEETPPEDEWLSLSVRKHRLELISDSVSRRTFGDVLELPTLVENASELELAIRKIPLLERRIASARSELDEILEALLVFSNAEKYRAELRDRRAIARRLTSEWTEGMRKVSRFWGEKLSFGVVLTSISNRRVLDMPYWDRPYLFQRHNGPNQQWEFEHQIDGTYKIKSLRHNRYLVGGDAGKQLSVSSGDEARARWSLQDRGSDRYSITNVSTGLVLDVEGNRAGNTPIISWPYHGGNNQLWRLSLPPTARYKSTFRAEEERMLRPLRAKDDQRRKEWNRIKWLERVLADLSEERKTQLEADRDALETTVRDLQDRVNGLNSNYIATAGDAAGAQTMALVAEDPLGLKTYGAVLGFASPASGVTSAATAEGNVQLSYFDTQGRMRFSQYDATSDSANATYEQWLPSTIAVCPDLSEEDSVVRLDASDPIRLGSAGHTVEAWFYYPLPFAPSGRPYPYAYLTSDASGSQAAIAVANNQRLGVVVDGFFHDSGTDLTVELDRGWHHVAAKTSGDATLLYLDGEPTGHSPAELQTIRRYAMTFEGGAVGSTSSGLTLGSMSASDHNYSNGFTLQAWVRWDELAFWSRVVDFGSGADTNNIILANFESSDTLTMHIKNGDEMGELSVPNAIQTGVWTNVAATIKDGVAVLYVNGFERARGECLVPASVDRTRSYIGLSNWHDRAGAKDKPFKGAMSSVMVWNRALSVSEVQRFAYAPPAPDSPGLLHHWPMSVRQNGDALEAQDAASTNHAAIGGSVSNRQLSGRVSAPVVALGNHRNGGAPAGKLAEVRVWDTALTDEEIRYHSLIHLSGNEPDLRACYRLDDVIGTTETRDFTGRHRAGTLERATVVARTAKIGHPGTTVGRFESAPEATGTRLPAVNLANRSFTIETWIKRDREQPDVFVQCGTANRSQGLHMLIRNNTCVFGFYFDDLVYDLDPDAALAVNDWVHICNTFDASSRKMTMYIDGKQVKERTADAAFSGSGHIRLGGGWDNSSSFNGQMSELRIWDHARTSAQVAAGFTRRVTGSEDGLLAHLPFTNSRSAETVSGSELEAVGHRSMRSDDLPIVPGPSLVTAEYSTVGVDPDSPEKQRAVLRRFLGYSDAAGDVGLLPGKRIEELILKWIGNAQFEPTLLGYMEGAPPVPSENLTINYDYDSATSVELVQSDEVAYSWNRNREVAAGLDINTFLGAAWSVSGGAFIQTKVTEGHAGARGTLNNQWRDTNSSMIKASSTDTSRDRLDLRGSFETTPRFEHLGNRYVPKNVGYALVISGMADVFITQMRRTGRMVAYDVVPMEDMPPDVNTITFLINPAYTLNGSLDGLVGSHAADPRFYRHVPEMRAQYGSRYPASYFNLRQAYDLKAQIERWDKQRESYFFNFDARETGPSAELTGDIPPAGSRDDYGEVELKDDNSDDSTEDGEKKEKKDRAKAGNDLKDSYAKKGAKDITATKKRVKEIEELFDDADRIIEANTAFDSWQRRMENLQIKAAKRNIFNTYVWDADGGIRFEEQSVANTIEHTIGGTFSVNATLGFDGAIQIGGFKGELQAMATHEMSQTMSKTQTSTRSFELNVRLDGLERKGITDSDDYPVQPGEKVDRYRFMSFYLEGNTDHFTDFFDYVVDPEWLMSNDEEARALRQVARGRPNKTWRVMHRVTYVERPALMGFGRDLRQAADLEQANQQVFNYFDSLEQDNMALRSQIEDVSEQLTKLAATVTEVKDLAGKAGAGSGSASSTSGSGSDGTVASGIRSSTGTAGPDCCNHQPTTATPDTASIAAEASAAITRGWYRNTSSRSRSSSRRPTAHGP